MSLFTTNEDALIWTKSKKLFKLQSRDMTVICQKRNKNDYRQIANPIIAEEKIRTNTLEQSNNDCFITINFDIFKKYDDRDQQIKEIKQQIKEWNKQSHKILNIDKAIAVKGAMGKTVLVDLKHKEYKEIDSGLVEDVLDVGIVRVKEILHDSQVNQYKKEYERNKKLWESL